MIEEVCGFLKQTADEIGIHHSERYMPMFGTLFFLILFANLIGLIPGFESPTMNYAMPLGCASGGLRLLQLFGFKGARRRDRT